MSISEIYLPADRYAFEVAQISDLLQHRLPANPDDAQMAVHAQLRASGIYEQDSACYASHRSFQTPELVEALIALQPSPFTGEIDNSDVRLILGEVGNVWPETVRVRRDE